jgi:rSAM/selenodomain-associated transferase 1
VLIMAWNVPDGAVLGIFGKLPVPGRVKTRLATEFGPEDAAAMHEAMLFDLIHIWDSSGVFDPGARRVLAYAPGDAGAWFEARLPASFALRSQAEGDLGRRMQAFFAGEFERGATRVVLIGSDAPTLDPTIILHAFRCLDNCDVVLGPAADGGYYLVGSRRAPPPVFEGVDWSTPDVLRQTADRLRKTDLSLAVLPPWYDVDTPDDCRMLAGHLHALRLAGIDPRLPRTEAVLERLRFRPAEPLEQVTGRSSA